MRSMSMSPVRLKDENALALRWPTCMVSTTSILPLSPMARWSVCTSSSQVDLGLIFENRAAKRDPEGTRQAAVDPI